MDRKKILIISASFYPKNSPRANRATELAKEFARQGHSVKVLTVFGNADYNAIAKDFGISIANLGELKWRSPNFGNSKIGYFLNRVFFRLLSLLVEYPSIELMFKVKTILKNEKGYDLLISLAHPYPIHWGVAATKNLKQTVARIWVADCGDPYMGCQTDRFKKLFYFKYVEKWFMRKADFISIPVDSARKGYYQEFHPKIRVIPQGFKFEEIIGQNQQVNNSVPTFLYAGGFYPNIRDPRPLLDYLSTLEKEFKFIIFTTNKQLLLPYIPILKEKLVIYDYIPRHKLLEFMVKMDFLVNIDNNTDVQVPSKLIDYGLTKRPILNINSSNFNSNIVDEFLNGNYSNQFIVDNIEQYRIENVVKQFLDLIQE